MPVARETMSVGAALTASREREPLPDAELARLAAAGDSAAWIAIFDQYHAPIFRYIRARTDDEAASDLASDVFAAAVSSIGRYSGERPLLAWLYGIARHHVAEFHRRRQRQTPFLSRLVALWPLTNDPERASAHLEPPSADPYGDPRFVETQLDVQAALARLTADQREVLTLRYFAGLTTREIASAMGRAPAAVYSLEARALMKLRSDLSASGEDDR
jgi:RNA polymerase sigma-70 factor (ECF subfamily)